MEQDHRFIKKRIISDLWFKAFESAKRTLTKNGIPKIKGGFSLLLIDATEPNSNEYQIIKK